MSALEPILESYRVDIRTLEGDQFGQFFVARGRQMLEWIAEAMGKRTSTDVEALEHAVREVRDPPEPHRIQRVTKGGGVADRGLLNADRSKPRLRQFARGEANPDVPLDTTGKSMGTIATYASSVGAV